MRRSIDERLAALATFVRSGEHYERAWELFRYGQFKGLSDEQTATEFAAWCRRIGLEPAYGIRKVREVDVVLVLLEVSRRAW